MIQHPRLALLLDLVEIPHPAFRVEIRFPAESLSRIRKDSGGIPGAIGTDGDTFACPGETETVTNGPAETGLCGEPSVEMRSV